MLNLDDDIRYDKLNFYLHYYNNYIWKSNTEYVHLFQLESYLKVRLLILRQLWLQIVNNKYFLRYFAWTTFPLEYLDDKIPQKYSKIFINYNNFKLYFINFGYAFV